MFPAVDCDFVNSMYGTKLRRYALEDFNRIDVEDEKQTHGAYQCFCELELAKDYSKAITADYGHPKGTPICEIYDEL